MGNRIVAYAVDAKGRPVLSKKIRGYRSDVRARPGRSRVVPFKPRGGVARFAPYREVVAQWDRVPGLRPEGTPVGLTVARDGALWIVEDKNATVLRLVATRQVAAAPKPPPAPRASRSATVDRLAAWTAKNAKATSALRRIRRIVIGECSRCHPEVASGRTPRDFLHALIDNKNWLTPGWPDRSPLYRSVAALGPGRTMPLERRLAPRHVRRIKSWIASLPRL